MISKSTSRKGRGAGRKPCASCARLYLDAEPVAAHRPDFGALDGGQSCIRFARIAPLPWTTVAHILRATYARPRRVDSGPAIHSPSCFVPRLP